jgi:hypothetical protein
MRRRLLLRISLPWLVLALPLVVINVVMIKPVEAG